MIVSEFLKRRFRREPKTVRDRTTYRAARRNIAKIAYRQAKKAALKQAA